MTLQQLKYIAAIADHGSFNEAAKALYITQPSLSGAVRELEKELGFTLFNRTNKGAVLTVLGAEFLAQARAVIEQAGLLEQQYLHKKPEKQRLAVSAQHYTFVVEAFTALIRRYGSEEYDLFLRETQTSEVIADVKCFKSELGVLYLSDFNEKIVRKLLRDNHLNFYPLFSARPSVSFAAGHPLACRASLTLADLEAFPYLCYEQGQRDSLYFSEEILSTLSHRKRIVVNDRATLFSLLTELGGYTISTGVINGSWNGTEIIHLPLDVNESITVGYITVDGGRISWLAQCYLQQLEALLREKNLISSDACGLL